MTQAIGPREAKALIDGGDLDVIDVREPHEWSAGHIAGARNIPLFDFKASPSSALKGDRVLFVCARGMRSLSAAQVAASLGGRQIFSLDGGTSAWAQAGLPLVAQVEPPEATRASPAAPAEAAACGLPEPALDEVVSVNLKKLRALRGLSLDALARATGLSRALLGQIELGRASSSVNVVWRLARAFGVPFSTLLATAEPVVTSVQRASSARRLVSPDGRFSSRALPAPGPDVGVEFYELYLAPHSREDAQPHQPGTRESLAVTEGRLELLVAGERYTLGKGDAIHFGADVEHSYLNPGGEECWLYLVMTYGQAEGRAPSLR